MLGGKLQLLKLERKSTMDDRLAQVRALVNERWRVAQEKKQRNALLRRRVDVLESFLHSEMLMKYATQRATVDTMKIEILKETSMEETCRRQVAERDSERERVEARVRISGRQVNVLKKALSDEKTRINAMWAEMKADRDLLREEDAEQAELEHQAQRTNKVSVQQLHKQSMELEKLINAKKMDTEKAKKTLDTLKQHKRSLETDFGRAQAENKSLKSKIAKLRGPSYAAVVEEGIDAVLRELDAMLVP